MRLLSDTRGDYLGQMGWHDDVLCIWRTVWTEDVGVRRTPHGRMFRLLGENDVGCERWVDGCGSGSGGNHEESSRTHEGIVRRTWRRLRRR